MGESSLIRRTGDMARLWLPILSLILIGIVLSDFQSLEEKPNSLERSIRHSLNKRDAGKKGEKAKKSNKRRKKRKLTKKSKKERKTKSGTKSLRKKGRKGRKNTRKNNKKGKCIKGKKKCKSRIKFIPKGRKVTKKGRKKSRQTTDWEKCASQLIEYTSRLRKARNLYQQYRRINNTKDIIEKKKGKKMDFNETLGTLVEALGGNKTSPKCSSSSRAIIRAFNDTLATLDMCESDIDANCLFNSTVLDDKKDCYDTASLFQDAVQGCFNNSLCSSDADKCGCFAKNNWTDQVEKIKSCDLTQENNKAKTEKTKCKEKVKCGGVTSKEEGERQLNIITPLKNALDNPNFENALKKLGLDSGPGSDGVLPAKRWRTVRQAEEAPECTKILEDWRNFNASADQAVQGVDGDVDEEKTTETINTLDKLNNNPNLEADLAKCSKDSSRQAIVSITYIRFYVFWCVNFNLVIVEVKIDIITISFGLTTPPPQTTPALTTQAPSGRKVNRLQLFGRKM